MEVGSEFDTWGTHYGCHRCISRAYFRGLSIRERRSKLRFVLRVVGWAPLNAGEPVFTQITSVPFFTGTQHPSQSECMLPSQLLYSPQPSQRWDPTTTLPSSSLSVCRQRIPNHSGKCAGHVTGQPDLATVIGTAEPFS
jgi:hypothetical protein